MTESSTANNNDIQPPEAIAVANMYDGSDELEFAKGVQNEKGLNHDRVVMDAVSSIDMFFSGMWEFFLRLANSIKNIFAKDRRRLSFTWQHLSVLACAIMAVSVGLLLYKSRAIVPAAVASVTGGVVPQFIRNYAGV